MTRLDLTRTYASPEAAARAFADAARVRTANASASAARLRERGTLVGEGASWRLTAAPPRKGRLSLPA